MLNKLGQAGTAPLNLPAQLAKAAPATEAVKSAIARDAAQIGKDLNGLESAPKLDKLDWGDALSFKSLMVDTFKQSAAGGMKKTFEQLTKLLANFGIEQYWPHSCVGAAAQQLWKENDPEGYAKASEQLAATGTLTLPNGETVTLDEGTIAQIRQEAGGDEKKFQEMLMQAALMEHATGGAWSPLSDDWGLFRGLDETAIKGLFEAVGVPQVDLNIPSFIAALTGKSAQEVLASRIEAFFEKHPNMDLSVPITTPAGNHQVIVTPTSDGQYLVTNPDGSPVALPPGTPNPMSAEQLAALIPPNPEDVGNIRPRPRPTGGGEFS